MADYFAFPRPPLITNISFTSWGNGMIFTEKMENELL
jgi:hypothetical protein